MTISRVLLVPMILGVSLSAFGATEYLVKFKSQNDAVRNSLLKNHGGKLEKVSPQSELFKWTVDANTDLRKLGGVEGILYIQKNNPIRFIANPTIINQREALINYVNQHGLQDAAAYTDNPDIQEPGIEASGADKLLDKSWGIFKVGADAGWANLPQGKDIVVAVTDTGVDYNHADLISNMWRNKGETAGDGVDNDNNGYIDDVVGFDFYADDAKPYDLSMSMAEILFQGGNPGHGTHVAGVVGARLNNSIGTAGVAPLVKIMALRFISEKGQGDTAGAVKAIDYAVANGANVINASWGSEGEEEGDEALREAIQRAETAGVIFVAAAGNGRASGMTAAGYNNDTDPKPMYPASYPYNNIVAVAAMDSSDKLGEFSNFGPISVDIGAPGVKIMSTVPGNRYQDTVIELGSTKITWDGTSMASPFVAGTLAQIWSKDRTLGWADVKSSLLSNAVAVSALSGKVATGGRIDLKKVAGQ